MKKKKKFFGSKNWNFTEKKNYFLVHKIEISLKKNIIFWFKKLKFGWKKNFFVQKIWNFVEKKNYFLVQKSWNFVGEKKNFFGSWNLKFRWKNSFFFFGSKKLKFHWKKKNFGSFGSKS